MAPPPTACFDPETTAADTVLWKEALFAADILLLHSSPIYYGLGVSRGDGSAVVLVPGFLGTDRYLGQLHSWLGRIGYRPFFSRIGFNAECPNLLIQRRLNESIDNAIAETGAKKDPSHRAQPGRHHRASSCRSASERHRIGHHIGLTVSRYGGSPHRPARG